MYLLAIHEGCGVKRKVHTVINNVHSCDEQDDDGRHLGSQLLIRDEDRKCDDIDDKSQDPHYDADITRGVESLSIYHSFSLLTGHWLSALSPIVVSLSLSKHK